MNPVLILPPPTDTAICELRSTIPIAIPRELIGLWRETDGLETFVEFEVNGQKFLVESVYGFSDQGQGSILERYLDFAVTSDFIRTCQIPIAENHSENGYYIYSGCDDDYGSVYFLGMDQFESGESMLRIFSSLGEFFAAAGLNHFI